MPLNRHGQHLRPEAARSVMVTADLFVYCKQQLGLFCKFFAF